MYERNVQINFFKRFVVQWFSLQMPLHTCISMIREIKMKRIVHLDCTYDQISCNVTNKTLPVVVGEPAEIRYSLNVSGYGGGSLYLYLDEDWQEAKETNDCLHRLKIARLVRKSGSLYGSTSKYRSLVVSLYPRATSRMYQIIFTCIL